MKSKNLTPQGAKILKMCHILFAFMWIIGGVALCLGILLTSPETGDELYMRSLMLKMIDDYLIAPGATLVLLTGVVYGIWTNWGFFKHRWLAVKWVMAVLLILVGMFILGPCVDENVIIADRLRDAALTDPVFLKNLNTSKLWGAGQTICVLMFIIISVQKPWRKKRVS